MRSLLVSSIDEYSGKSGIIAALGEIFREKGLKVGYFKPFTTFDDADVEIMKDILSLKSKVLMVAKYSGDFTIDKLLSSSKVMGDMLSIINQVTGFKRTYFGTIASKILEPNGIKLVGMLPKDELLAGMCVEEIRKALNGMYLVEPKEDVLIESFLIGAMSPQAATSYFRSARNAAVITGGDRADLHAVAIELLGE